MFNQGPGIYLRLIFTVVIHTRVASCFMVHNPKFGPSAQTPQQRAWVLEQMQTVIPSLKAKAPPHALQLYQRYVAGELSWGEVRQALDGAPA